ncbi:MAG: ParB N-terminal domain-containing protein [Clostridia bacterium]|nr:ParB N-terminal domain-containing protein [Clostridia bacterium]
MTQTVKIGSTLDYRRFNLLNSNKAIKQRNVEKLIKSFQLTKGMSKSKPIICDSDFNVIDGQHRLEACKRMGIPVHYIITDDKVETIPIYNAFQEKWGMDDYARYYANRGNENYQRIIDLRNKAGISLSGCIECVIDSTSRQFNDNFKEGRFIFDGEIDKMLEYISKVIELCQVITGKRVIKRKISRAVRFLEKTETFNLDELIEKLKKYPGKIRTFGSSDEYIEFFVDMFNFRRREEKISGTDILAAKNS